MIKIYIKDDGNNRTITLNGHAEYDEKGKDIVCASVSTIFQLAVMGLHVLAEQYPENVQITEKD